MFLKVLDDVICALGGFGVGMYQSDLMQCGYEQVLFSILLLDGVAGEMAHVQTNVQV